MAAARCSRMPKSLAMAEVERLLLFLFSVFLEVEVERKGGKNEC